MTIQFNSPVVADDQTAEGRTYKAVQFTWPAPDGLYGRVGKRAVDLILVIVSLPIVLPLIGLLAILVAMDGGKPFFWQKRLGRNGKEFSILKLRTMIPNADQVLQQYLDSNAEARREWDHKQKLCRDPRITWIGRLLRKTSMDELPQLWNVVLGEMSLVGPRPMMVHQKTLYSGQHYYSLKPGLTGLWQVSDRNESSFADRVAYDAEYYRTLSLGLDVSLIVRTIGVVLRGTGY